MGVVLRCQQSTKQELPQRHLRADWLTSRGPTAWGTGFTVPSNRNGDLEKGSYLNKEFIQGPEGRPGKGASR